MMRLGFTREEAASEKFQSNTLLGITVRNVFDFLANLHFDSKFFPQFANQAFLERFARLKLATRKFPQTAEMIIQPPLRD